MTLTTIDNREELVTPVTKKKATNKKTPTRKTAPPKPAIDPMTTVTVSRVRLGDNREVRITRIPTGFGEDLIRVGINTLPFGENMSGAIFPESYLDEVMEAMEAARNA